MNDVPHQWILDHLSALCLMGEMDKEEVDRLYALFVQRFQDEVADMKKLIFELTQIAPPVLGKSWMDLEQQGDNYITESAKQHDPQCWKNVAYRELGVGGRLASCTCGVDDA